MRKDAGKVYYINIVNDTIYKMIFLKVFGTYKNSEHSKTFNIDGIYYYNRIGKSFGMISGKTRDDIIKAIDDYNKIQTMPDIHYDKIKTMPDTHFDKKMFQKQPEIK